MGAHKTQWNIIKNKLQEKVILKGADKTSNFKNILLRNVYAVRRNLAAGDGGRSPLNSAPCLQGAYISEWLERLLTGERLVVNLFIRAIIEFLSTICFMFGKQIINT